MLRNLLYSAGGAYNAYRQYKKSRTSSPTGQRQKMGSRKVQFRSKTKRRGGRGGYGQGGTTTGAATVVLRSAKKQGWTKSALKDISERRYQTVTGTRISAGIGYQGIGIYHLLNATIMNTIKTTESSGEASKLYISKAFANYKLLNNSNGVMQVAMYFIIPRRDTIYSAKTAWTSGNTAQSMSGYAEVLGAKPFQSQEFTSMYYVKKVKNIELGPGGTYNQKMICSVERSYNTSLYGAEFDYIRKFTGSVMFVVSGFPQNDLTTVTQVSSGACGLDIIEEMQISYYPIQQKSVLTTLVDNTVKAFTVAGKVYTEAGAAEQTGDVA